MNSSIGLLLLRVGFGGYMLLHGIGKVSTLLDGKAAEFPDPLGMGSTLSLYSAIGAEVGCAALVIVGFWTRLAALPLVFTMGVAAFVVHAEHPWSGGSPSKEMAMLYLIAFLALVFTGAGSYSIDGKKAKAAGGDAGDPA